jgi:hypothetical protein
VRRLRLIYKRDALCISILLRNQFPFQRMRAPFELHVGDQVFGLVVEPQSLARRLKAQQTGGCRTSLQPDDGLGCAERERLGASRHAEACTERSDKNDLDEITGHSRSQTSITDPAHLSQRGAFGTSSTAKLIRAMRFVHATQPSGGFSIGHVVPASIGYGAPA